MDKNYDIKTVYNVEKVKRYTIVQKIKIIKTKLKLLKIIKIKLKLLTVIKS